MKGKGNVFTGSAFPRRSLILTQDGLKDIYDIKEGDYVLTSEGSFAKVLEKHEILDYLVEIKGHGHPGFRTVKKQNIWATNYNRVWDNEKKISERKFNRRSWVLAEDVKGFFWSSPIKFPSFKISDDIDFELTQDIYWIIGAYLCNGFIMYDGTIYLKTNDFRYEELEEVLNKLKWNYRKKRVEAFTEYFIYNKEVSKWLKNTFSLKYGIKNIPFGIYGANEKCRKQLFKGFIWANGIFEDNKYRVSTNDKYLAIGFKLIAQSLGYSVALYMTSSKKNKKTIERWQIVSEVNARSSAILGDCRLGLIREVNFEKRNNIIYSLKIEGNKSYLVDGIFVK